MAFERKTAPDIQPSATPWKVLKGYLMLMPILYFIFVLPSMTQGAEAAVVQANNLFTLLFHLLNLSLAGIMHQTNAMERSRTGAGAKILVIIGVQQLVTRSILGFILTLFVWYKFPRKMKPEWVSQEEKDKKTFQPVVLYVLAGVVLVISLLAMISQII